MADPTPLQPIRTDERIEAIDVVRGFALFGVLLANLVWWTQREHLEKAARDALPTARLDAVVTQANTLLIEGKFFTLFSFLFGLGFAVQLQRAAARGGDGTRIYRRRLLVLLGIGLLHNTFVWAGDVLHIYALLGLLLPFANRLATRTLLWSGLVTATLLPAVVHALHAMLLPQTDDIGPTEGFAALTQGPFLRVIEYFTVSTWDYWRSSFGAGFTVDVFGRFLLGIWAGRVLLLHEPLRHARLFRWLLAVGLAVGLLGNAVVVAAPDLFGQADARSTITRFLLPLVRTISVPALSAAYLAALVLGLQRPRIAAMLRHLAPVGRMALTNYLTQSLFYVLVFHGYCGLGLLGKVGSTFCLGCAVLLFAAQMLFSRVWLQRFRFGPAEWLWRSLTYGRPQPMRLPA
ncbi:MAG TPA: DUF418 domain-containing protein [Planctomycetota bacterium]|nr:DUF418 domain-containing protein [Planctomycetota bacterium]